MPHEQEPALPHRARREQPFNDSPVRPLHPSLGSHCEASFGHVHRTAGRTEGVKRGLAKARSQLPAPEVGILALLHETVVPFTSILNLRGVNADALSQFLKT